MRPKFGCGCVACPRFFLISPDHPAVIVQLVAMATSAGRRAASTLLLSGALARKCGLGTLTTQAVLQSPAGLCGVRALASTPVTFAPR